MTSSSLKMQSEHSQFWVCLNQNRIPNELGNTIEISMKSTTSASDNLKLKMHIFFKRQEETKERKKNSQLPIVAIENVLNASASKNKNHDSYIIFRLSEFDTRGTLIWFALICFDAMEIGANRSSLCHRHHDSLILFWWMVK